MGFLIDAAAHRALQTLGLHIDALLTDVESG